MVNSLIKQYKGNIMQQEDIYAAILNVLKHNIAFCTIGKTVIALQTNESINDIYLCDFTS